MAWATYATDAIYAIGATGATCTDTTCTDATTTNVLDTCNETPVLDNFPQHIHRVVTLTFLKPIGSPFRFRPFDLIHDPPKAGI